ncbi:anhydro-N-acetylmuramic acid kinase [Paenibacillus sp. CGMCC 1.16610]|uniref:Anhydro-N-acetylmuramic acid kinase n=1 Tax=Paenibacillus anseongense TaxID=2682845 RepID=A0ABW9U082_9BACL|nr:MULTISPECIES: anhydro-N-acetylmuramic acid kinase [Paenibacillus]MBA2943011.1 anhydro-N-acetylmuramic acid kinase [Paenibacillus sp. CGMCC 1.16610]MVQ33507.1 anhydro-N-acetylmuramic acid kinase [Paenibacillus anseongense]
MLRTLLNQTSLTVAGIMSGTSLDGIDVAIVRIDGSGIDAKVKLLHFESFSYEEEVREKLKQLCSIDHSNVALLCGMNFAIAERFADAVVQTAKAAGIKMEEIDLISTHGQTVWHIPVADETDPYLPKSTLQIGDLSVIAKRTGRVVVGDFRTADMAVGGQGAPLAPYGDFIMFRDATKGRILQNIGGIGNCTAIPAQGPDAMMSDASELIAFDTGPGNMIMDQVVYELSEGRLTYDADGAWAARGQVHTELLEEMLAHPYFAQLPPKTTGRELFGKAYTAAWLKGALARGLAHEDIVATATAFTAHSIARAYKDFVLPHCAIAEVIVSGGGARNRTLLNMMQELLPEQAILTSDELGISGDAKEAILFALLGNDCIHGVPNNLPSATGAERLTVMGKLALP